jgi:hypothetical protein
VGQVDDGAQDEAIVHARGPVHSVAINLS